MVRTLPSFACLAALLSGAAPQPVHAAGNSSWRLDGNVAGFVSVWGDDLPGTGFSHIQPTDRSPHNYIGFDYTYVREPSEGGGFFRFAAADVNPHLEFDFYARDLRPVTYRRYMFSQDWRPVFRPTPFSDPLSIDFRYGTNYAATDNNMNMLRMRLAFYDVWVRFEPERLERTSFRIGHFDIPYGSNFLVSTRPGDFITAPEAMDIWMKKDWGLIWKAPLGTFDYEIAATMGMGLGIHNPYWFDDKYPGTYALSARVGTTAYSKVGYGLSAFYGRTPFMLGSDLIQPYAPWRWRLNVDSFYHPKFFTTFAASIGAGQNERHPDDAIAVGNSAAASTLTGQVFASYSPQWFRSLEVSSQVKVVSYDLNRSTATFLSTTAQTLFSLTDALLLRIALEWVIQSPKVIGPEDVRWYFGLNYYR